MSRRIPLPSANDLTPGQHQGWNCVWCDRKLWVGAVSAGRAKGMTGKVPYSIEVYACPLCGVSPRSGRAPQA